MRLIDRNAQLNRWRRIPAAEKATLAIGMMVIALLGGWPAQVLILLLMLMLLVAGARVPARDVFASITLPVSFIALSSLAQLITLRFEGLRPVFGISLQSLVPALQVALRSFACVSALLFLALTTPLTDIVGLLRRVGVPAEISDIALMMFRFIWLTLDCVESGVQSQSNRLGYATYRGGLKSMGLLLASLLPRVLSRARRLEAGLAARGYAGDLRFIELDRPSSVGRVAGIALLLLGAGLIGHLVR